MSDSLIRDQACQLASTNTAAALAKARSIKDAWYRGQALSCVARYAKGSEITYAREAARAARDARDTYQRCAVRAWEIAALAGSGHRKEASVSLQEALAASRLIELASSHAEALMLLLAAAAHIDDQHRDRVCEEIRKTCEGKEHWRCRRALRDIASIPSGQWFRRGFFH